MTVMSICFACTLVFKRLINIHARSAVSIFPLDPRFPALSQPLLYINLAAATVSRRVVQRCDEAALDACDRSQSKVVYASVLYSVAYLAGSFPYSNQRSRGSLAASGRRYPS